MLQLKFADSPGSMMVWRVRCTGPEYPSVGSAAPGAGASGMFFNVTTFMTLSLPYAEFRLFIDVRSSLATSSSLQAASPARPTPQPAGGDARPFDRGGELHPD